MKDRSLSALIVVTIIGLHWPVTLIAQGQSRAATLEVASVQDQRAAAGSSVASAPAVRVRDQRGDVMTGVTVAFAVASGGGTLGSASATSASATTDGTGVARVTSWRLGNSPGVNAVTASVSNTQGQDPTPVTINATGILVATSMEAAAPTSGTLDVSTQVVPAPAVLVRDQFHHPLQGVTISFGGITGGGSITPSSGSVSTQADGIAHLGSWTLGPNLGTNKVMAKLSPLTPVEFTRTAALTATTMTALPRDPLPDLDPKISQSSNPIVAGNQQTYTVKLYNRGAKTAAAVVLRNTLPGDLTFVSNRADHGFVCTRSGTTMNCSAGTVAVGDSAIITIGMSLPIYASSGHDILFSARADPDNLIGESNETNNVASAATTTQAHERLGEEVLQSRGILDPRYFSPSGIKQLDCKDLGASFVLVGLEGNGEKYLERLRLECSDMKSGGALSTNIQTTAFFLNTGTSSLPRIEKHCPAGSAVTGAQATLDNGRLVSLALQCRHVVATGLTSGSVTTLPPFGVPGPTLSPLDSCTNSRPVRAVKIGVSRTESIIQTYDRIVGEQLICEQPVVP
jgi:uncharacterized repeat protein (TIGR01451 family)